MNSRTTKRQLFIESLEVRRTLYGGADVIVTNTHVETEFDRVPRFISTDSVTAIKSGNWSDPRVWNHGRVPTSGESVLVPHGIELQYDLNNASKLDAIEVSGRLSFRNDIDTSLWVSELMVMPDGNLTIGTEANPISKDFSAEIVFVDSDFKSYDQEQFGHGLIVFGTLSVRGSAKSSYSRAADDIVAGQSTTLVNSTPVGWTSGDRLLIPQTAQTPLLGRRVDLNQTEVVRLVSMNDQTIIHETVTSDHLGVSQNSYGVQRQAHIANLSRNVVLRSENPSGIRGHAIAMGNASVDLAFARFESLGRTSAESPVDNTVFGENGEVLYQGTNQIGRYPLHLHHVDGPIVVRNSVFEDNRKWGIAIHDTDYGSFENNIIFDSDGAGFMTEDGSEVGSVFRDNLVVKVDGGHQRNDKRAGITWHTNSQGNRFLETGVDGSGFWLRSTAGTFEGNFVYDVAGYGFNFNGYYRTRNAPEDFSASQVDSFANNEVVSSLGGLWLSWSQGQIPHNEYQRQLFHDFLAWNISKDAVHAYHDANITFQRFTIIGNPQASNANVGSPSQFTANTSKGFYFGNPSYENFNYQLQQIQVSGMNIGIVPPVHAGTQGTLLDGAELANQVNIAFAQESRREVFQASHLVFSPSLVSPRVNSLPSEVANIWQEGTGIIEVGSLDDNAGGQMPVLPSNIQLLPDGRLKVEGSNGNDRIVITALENMLMIESNGQSTSIAISSVDQIIVWGFEGDDWIENRTAKPIRAFGGEGNDVLIGGSGDDLLRGNEGNDRIFGNDGVDILYGDRGMDLLAGGLGRDRLRGGLGLDTLLSEIVDFVVDQEG